MWRAVPGGAVRTPGHLPTCASRKDTGTVCGTVQAGRTPALPKDTGTMWRAVPGGAGSSTDPRKLGVLRDAPRTALGRCPRCCADPLRGRYAELEAVGQPVAVSGNALPWLV